MKIVHFFIDEKFTDFMLHLFDQYVYDQQYLMVLATKNQQIKFPDHRIQPILINEVNDIIATTQPQLVIFHSLFDTNLQVLDILITKAPVCWFSWGGDIALDPVKPFKTVHEPKTLALYYSYSPLQGMRNGFWNAFKILSPALFSRYYKFRTGQHWQHYLQKKNLHKISIVNTITHAEKQLFIDNNYKGKFIHIPIGTIELLLDGVDTTPKKSALQAKPVVFIGHSAYSENNHFDVLYLLKQANYQGGIICPLSYGDTGYAEKVIAYGTSLFGEDFTPVTQYLNKKEYYELLSRCDFYLNNSIIQQGVGNILAALYMGKHVLLNRNGKVYSYLLELGINTWTIEGDITKCCQANHYTFDITDIRNKIDKVYSEKNVKEGIDRFLYMVAHEC